MNQLVVPKPGDILEESTTDFKAHYIVLSKHGTSNYRLYTLYVESEFDVDCALQGTIDLVHSLEINDDRKEWSIIS